MAFLLIFVCFGVLCFLAFSHFLPSNPAPEQVLLLTEQASSSMSLVLLLAICIGVGVVGLLVTRLFIPR